LLGTQTQGPQSDASLLNHSFSSGWLGSWASAGVQSSRKIRTIRIITVDRLPSFKGYASKASAFVLIQLKGSSTVSRFYADACRCVGDDHGTNNH
jgi:hypothetical protein